MKTVLISSPREKTFALSLVGEIEPDGTMEVIIKKIDGSSTAKQRRLRWLWMGEVAVSGLGQHDTKEDVDLGAKWQFARPILLRDDDMFGAIYAYFMDLMTGTAAFSVACKQFTEQYISVSRMTKKQQSEYLSEFQRFWIGKGVNLTDPASQGVNLEKIWRS